ncbi:MAG: Mov34/MPN/PAD-1 family protein [Vicinamibacterales bacterium]
MSGPYVNAPGEAATIDSLRSAKGRDLAERVARGSLPYVSFVETRTAVDADVVVLDVETEVPQVREHDIRPVERVAVWFDHLDARTPEVLALREDFPATAHLNPPVEAIPKSLCLFEEEYAEVRRRWTSAFFIRRLQEWLRLTARGELHADDQPLEQVLAGTGDQVILPHALSVPGSATDAGQVVRLRVAGIDEHRARCLIQVDLASGDGTSRTPDWFSLSFTSSPRGPGPIASTPRTIGDLHTFLAAGGDDVVDVLRRLLLEWPREAAALAARLLLIVRIPKRRSDTGDVERVETWAFLGPSVLDAGVALGVWETGPRGFALMVPMADERRGHDAPLTGLSVVFRISRHEAAFLNGRERPDDRRIVGIGAGALGSQVILNAARAAVGQWTLVDRDRLLPHNLARHAVAGFGTGHHKVNVLAFAGNGLTDGQPAFESIIADVLNPGPERERLEERLGNADLILDMAASIPVSRHLAQDAPGAAKRVSFFLNPVGSDLVMLAEDGRREIRLDALEMQYYRAVLRDARLRDHLRAPDGRMRYGTSCRDVSARLPQAQVALHAAIAARRLPVLADQDDAAIRIWQASERTDDVVALDLAPRRVTRQAVGDWTVVYDDGLVETIVGLRHARLPNETGGVLLGAFDVERRIVYVVDTISSPLDSQERTTLYIRGVEGLHERLKDAQKRTFGQLEYVGEWHSHPDGCPCMPSRDDLTVLSWLSSHMDADGVPGVMMIACRGAALTVLLAEVLAHR